MASTRQGTTLNSVSALANVRMRQTVQYGSPRNTETSVASANDESTGAAIAALMNTVTRRSVLNSVGASLSQRTRLAAISASVQLVRNSRATSGGDMPAASSGTTWTGSAARQIHHWRTGSSSNAAVRIAFGGQSRDVVAGGNVSARPI